MLPLQVRRQRSGSKSDLHRITQSTSGKRQAIEGHFLTLALYIGSEQTTKACLLSYIQLDSSSVLMLRLATTLLSEITGFPVLIKYLLHNIRDLQFLGENMQKRKHK